MKPQQTDAIRIESQIPANKQTYIHTYKRRKDADATHL